MVHKSATSREFLSDIRTLRVPMRGASAGPPVPSGDMRDYLRTIGRALTTPRYMAVAVTAWLVVVAALIVREVLG